MIYRLKAVWRFLIFWLLRPLARFGAYEHESVTIHYLGWYELPVFGCVVFVKNDGHKQYYW